MTGHINRLSSSRNISIWLKWEGKKKIRALWEYRNLMAFISQRAWPSPCLALDMHYTCSLTWPHTPASTLYAAPLSPATCVLADTRTTSSTRDQTWNYILFPWLGNATVQKRIRTISKRKRNVFELLFIFATGKTLIIILLMAICICFCLRTCVNVCVRFFSFIYLSFGKLVTCLCEQAFSHFYSCIVCPLKTHEI